MTDFEQPKTVTFVASSLTGGGAEKVCVNVANGLASMGWEVSLVVLNMNGSKYHSQINSDVNFVVLGVQHVRYSTFPLFRYLKANNVKNVVVFNYILAINLVLMRLLLPISYNLISRNINSLTRVLKKKGVKARLVRWLILKLYHKSDHVINQCKAMDEDFLQVFPDFRGKTSVIYNPVNRAVEDYVTRYGCGNKIRQDYLLCIGRLEEQKSLHFALQAFAALAPRYPELRLKFVGTGRLEEALKVQAKQLGVAERTDFEGFQEDIISYVENAQLTLLTSQFEGFPNVLVESIVLGTPIVAFDCVSGPSEIVMQGVNGFLVPQNDTCALAKAVENVLVSISLSNRILVQSTSKAFRNKVIIPQWEKLLSSLSKRSSSPTNTIQIKSQ